MKTILKLAPLCVFSLMMLLVVSSVAPYTGPKKNTSPKRQEVREKPAAVQETVELQEAGALKQEMQVLKARLQKMEEKDNLTPQQQAQMEEIEIQLQQMQAEYIQLTQPIALPMDAEQTVPPVNDDCPNATYLTNADCPVSITEDTSRATNEANEPATCCGNPLRPIQQQSVWFTFTNTTGSPLGVSASTAGSSYDTVLQVYTGSCGNLAPIVCGCNDDVSPPSDLTSHVGFVASPGVTYFIKVAARGGTPSPLPAHTLVFSLDCTAAINTAACSVNPASDSDPVGTTHSITVTVTNNSSPQTGVPVNVTITSGPNAAGSNVCTPTTVLTTDANGQAVFTYTSNGQTGTDTIQFCGSVGASPFSCTATKCWDNLTCPSNITKSTDPNQCSAVVTYATPSSACGTVTCSPASGSTFPVGTTTVTCTSTGGLSCSFTVTVNDTQAPSITCPANVNQNADPGQCNAVVNYTAPTVSDNCPGVGSPTCSPASGSTFAVGTTTVTCSVTDAAGNSNSCSFTVTVVDNQPPTFPTGCPSNITQGNDPGQCSAVVTYTNPTASDNCSAPVTCSPASGSTFPLGTTTVTCTATDPAGQTATCSFSVTVNDTQAPSITCPNITKSNDPGQCSAVVNYTAPTVSDNCPGVGSPTCNPASGSTFPVGTTTVSCSVTDAHDNTSNCSFTVTVNDTEKPSITCPANVNQNADPGQCNAVVNYTAPTVSDNCPGVGSPTCSPASGSTFAVGTTTVTCSVTDAAGNSNSCSFTVTVVDNQPPTFPTGCPSNITQGNDPGQCSAVVTYTNPTASDNCSAMVSCSPASGSTFPLGTTTVTCTATDPAGQTATCSFSVTVNDTESPTMTCPNITKSNDPGQCSAVVNYGTIATDNCPGVMTSCSPASGSTFPVGTTEVSCTATDAVGNTASCTFNVTVNDTQAPSITCPANVSQSNDSNQCGAIVNYSAPSVSDNCPGVGSPSCSPASGSTFAVGTTTVTCSVTDAAGNSSSCSFTVTVNDTQAPSITCPASITNAECGVPVFYAPMASDNCPGVTAVCNPPSGHAFPVGTSEVTCTATDAHGNQSSCSFTVTAADTTAPSITCPNNITTTCTSQAGRVVTFTATASDICDPNPSVSCSPASGSTFPVGTTTVTCTATDASGNSSSCSFTVTVNPVMSVLQDETNGNCLTLATCGSSGTYCFRTPNGSFSGPVVITQNGNTVNFQSGPGDPNLLQGGIDFGRTPPRGNARLTVVPGRTFTIIDRDITNSTCMCSAP